MGFEPATSVILTDVLAIRTTDYNSDMNLNSIFLFLNYFAQWNYCNRKKQNKDFHEQLTLLVQTRKIFTQ